MERSFQKSIDRMNGVLSSAPVTFLRAEGGSILAAERPDQRQEGAPFITLREPLPDCAVEYAARNG